MPTYRGRVDAARYKLTIAYDGTDFAGWQKQEPPDPDVPPDEHGQRPRIQLRTVQHVVEQAVREVLREPSVHVKGASRTDSGVHAAGQVAAFTTRPERERGVGWPVERGTEALVRALNGKLPADVLVLDAEPTSLGFDPIGGAARKAYSYTIHSGPVRPLWDRRYVAWTYHGIDAAPMHEAARHLIGEHDFVSFAQASHGRLTTVRTIFECRVEELAAGVERGAPSALDDRGSRGHPPGRRVRIYVEGSGFLYNMVRIIAGTLGEVGRGRRMPADIPRIIAAKDRQAAGPTLPPEGLRLEWIEYPS